MVKHQNINPVIRGFHPDPSICRVGKDYWLAVSSFEYFPALPIFHSRDLINWKLCNHAIKEPDYLNFSSSKSSEGIFAPTLRYHNGVFYLVTTDVGGIGNFYVTTTDPAGEWSPPIVIDEGTVKPWFDPSLLFDKDGKVYYTRRHVCSIHQSELDIETGKLLTPLREISQSFTGDDIEGPHLYRIGDWYYLMGAEGGTGWGHALSIGRSKSPWGPFEPCPYNPILTHRHLVNHQIRFTGHGDMIEAHDGSWWMVFLATRHQPWNGFPFHHMGRETFITPVHWKDGWPLVNQDEPINGSVQVPEFFDKVEEQAKIETNFTEPLDKRWTFRRTIDSERFKILPDGGLQLLGSRYSLEDCGPHTFIGQRISEPFFKAEVAFSFNPQTEGEEAGITLFMCEDFHVRMFMGIRNEKPILRVVQKAANLSGILNEQEHPSSEVQLQIEGSWRAYQISIIDGDDIIPLTEVDRRLLCTEVTTGWTGNFLGLYASGNGRDSTTPAVFTYFKMENQRWNHGS